MNDTHAARLTMRSTGIGNVTYRRERSDKQSPMILVTPARCRPYQHNSSYSLVSMSHGSHTVRYDSAHTGASLDLLRHFSARNHRWNADLLLKSAATADLPSRDAPHGRLSCRVCRLARLWNRRKSSWARRSGHDHVNDNDHAHEPTEDEDESALQSLIAHLIEDSQYSCRRPSRPFFCSS